MTQGMSREHLRLLEIDPLEMRDPSLFPGYRSVETENAAPADDAADDAPASGQAPCQCSDGPRIDGEGNPHADWLFVGEAPGAEEERDGRPFVGPSGKLLDNMLAALGLKRSQVFVTNAVRCRPPENRRPQVEEIEACRPALEEEIARVQPRVIVALGEAAARSLGLHGSVGDLRGQPQQSDGVPVPVVVTYHPAYLRRMPAAKRDAWHDLLLARGLLTRAA